MTPPTDDHDDPSGPSEAPNDDDRLAALRPMLRDEPVDTEPAATETRILGALDAAADAPAGHGLRAPADVGGRAGGRTTTRAGRQWSARPVLVAAALLAVVGNGAVDWSTAHPDGEFMASDGDAATSETTGAPGAAAGGAADSHPRDGDEELSETDAAADPTSTLAPAPPAAAAGALADLGSFDSVEQLRREDLDALLARVPDGPGTDPGHSTQFDQQSAAADACAAQRSATGEAVLGVATVAGTTVLVVQVDGGRALFELPSCRAVP